MNTRGSTQGSLLGRCRDLSDATSWQEFCDIYSPRVFAWCRRGGLGHQDAEDVTQDVLVRVARRMQHFVYQDGGNFSGFLRAIWQNAWLDFKKQRAADDRLRKFLADRQQFRQSAATGDFERRNRIRPVRRPCRVGRTRHALAYRPALREAVLQGRICEGRHSSPLA